MPCSHGYRSPRELYEKAIECRDGIFTIFGKTGIELLKAIEFYDQSKQEQAMGGGKTLLVSKQTFDELAQALNCITNGDKLHRCDIDTLIKVPSNAAEQEQTKMTRDEATKLVAKACGVPVGAMGGGNIVDALEALGLLKFDEPVTVQQEIISIPMSTPMGTHTHEVALQTIIKALNAKGYETIKNDKIYRIDYKDGTRIIYDY